MFLYGYQFRREFENWHTSPSFFAVALRSTAEWGIGMLMGALPMTVLRLVKSNLRIYCKSLCSEETKPKAEWVH